MMENRAVKVYKYWPDPDAYNTLDNVGDWSAFYTGEPLAPTWEPMYREEDQSTDRAGDFPSLIGGVPVFSYRAWETLRPLIGNAVEALPLRTDHGRYYAINVLDHVDALDYGRAEVKRFTSGRVMYVISYAFRPGVLKSKHMFKLPETARSDIYLSETFKDMVEQAKLEGIKFVYLAEAD